MKIKIDENTIAKKKISHITVCEKLFSSKLINNIELHRISRLLTGMLKLCWLTLFLLSDAL
jgi:hypothetical protein